MSLMELFSSGNPGNPNKKTGVTATGHATQGGNPGNPGNPGQPFEPMPGAISRNLNPALRPKPADDQSALSARPMMRASRT